jgi:hypothetical protein
MAFVFFLARMFLISSSSHRCRCSGFFQRYVFGQWATSLRVLELGLLSYGDVWYNRWRLFLEGGKLHANVAERAGAAAAARMHPSLRPSCNTKRFSLVFFRANSIMIRLGMIEYD